ncbi:tumor necrosis factor receptor superfamily member 8 isoform X3 [Catharus ustulatus]|uniref:tumor necrosis factor receptor superfamily member 8 isoform X3 n=1 Tax=Catharus ustulatus TaxID=91951 RepID=UPI00140DA2F5|nr:tumor necrosis factor receptor superfamily member 8 isoform X3 [Catharus ustulatus]
MAACSLPLGLCLLLLLQDVQTTPQTSLTAPHSCHALEDWFYDETSQKCCYQCPSGYAKKKACPQDPAEDCMTCGPNQYLSNKFPKPQCDACVPCPKELDLVEKQPCSLHAGRVCECRPGLFCRLSVRNSCTRCQPHSACRPGFGVKTRGTPTNDVTCEQCPPGTFSDQSSSTDTCKPHTNCAKLNKVMLRKGNATHDQVCLDQLPTYLTPSTLSVRVSTEKNKSEQRVIKESLVTSASGDLLSVTTAENPTITPTVNASTSAKGVVLWAVVLSVTVLLGGTLIFWKWKVCKKRILVLRRKRSDLMNKCAVSVNNIPKQIMFHAKKIILTPDTGLEEEDLIDRALPLETNNNLVSSTEKAQSAHWGVTDVTPSSGNAPDCSVDSRVRDHTNNRIEKLYIMKADTVIVGSVSEVPSGKNCAVRGCESNLDAQESLEEELEMHYPEQETESFPGNDVMVPVEEEGKEFHHPTTATEK